MNDMNDTNSMKYMLNELKNKILLSGELLKELIDRNEKLVNENNELRKQNEQLRKRLFDIRMGQINEELWGVIIWMIKN